MTRQIVLLPGARYLSQLLSSNALITTTLRNLVTTGDEIVMIVMTYRI